MDDADFLDESRWKFPPFSTLRRDLGHLHQIIGVRTDQFPAELLDEIVVWASDGGGRMWVSNLIYPHGATDEEFEAWLHRGEALLARVGRRELYAQPAQEKKQTSDPSPPRATTPGVAELPMDKENLAILRALAISPELMTQVDLAEATGLSRRTIGPKLTRLREAGLTCRPDGERGGEGISEEGRRRLPPDAPAR